MGVQTLCKTYYHLLNLALATCFLKSLQSRCDYVHCSDDMLGHGTIKQLAEGHPAKWQNKGRTRLFLLWQASSRPGVLCSVQNNHSVDSVPQTEAGNSVL